MDLWIDALHVVQGLDYVLQHGVAGHWANLDTWADIVELSTGFSFTIGR